LWFDSKQKKSAMRLIADIASKEMVGKLIEYSIKENGLDSAAHAFILFESSSDPLKAIAELHGQLENTSYSPDPESSYFLNCPASVYYLYTTDQTEDAKKYVNYACSYPDQSETPGFIAAIVQAASCLGEVFLINVFSSIEFHYEVESPDEVSRTQRTDLAKRVALAEAAACGQLPWALNYLQSFIDRGVDNLDEILGEAIISAARRGDSFLIYNILFEKAKQLKVDKTQRFMGLIACASAAALVNEHFVLAKTLMLMVPHLEAKPADLKELQKWPASKVARMFNAIRNYKIFTDIAMHSGLTSQVNSMAWSNALKKEYCLEKMSNEGFNYLVHDVEAMRLLFSYRPDPCLSPGKSIDRTLLVQIMQITKDKLPPADVVHFMSALADARRQTAAGNQSHLFRVRYFLDERSDSRASPDEERVCLEIREELSALFQKYSGSIFSGVRELATRLHATLLDAVSLQMVKKILDKETQNAPNSSLLKECKKIFNIHQEKLMRQTDSVGLK